MSYSRRQLEALGEPLGDSATHVKPGGHGRIYGGGGSGGGGGGNTTSTGTTYNTNIPEYAQPYVETMLGATQKQLFDMSGNEITGFKPYKPYSTNAADYVASFSPMQEQAMRTAASPQAFGREVQGYMSPYMQDVVDIQRREAARASGILGAQNQAQATNAGAFGGYREGLQRAENQRNLMTQMGDIQARGLESAYTNAQQQARANQNLQMQYGTMAQSQEQQKINQAIQDYANAQQYPLMQLGVMSNMLRGLPMQASTTNQYVAAPNPITQGIGVAGAGASLYNAFKGASGGLPREFKYASGGITDIADTPDPNDRDDVRGYVQSQNAQNGARFDVGGEVMDDLASMSEEDLKREAATSPSPRIRAMAKRMLISKSMDNAEESKGVPSVGPVGPMGVQYQAPVQAARGGILAFKEPNEDNNYGVTDSGEERSLNNLQLALAETKAKDAASKGIVSDAAPSSGTEYSIPGMVVGAPFTGANNQELANKISRIENMGRASREVKDQLIAQARTDANAAPTTLKARPVEIERPAPVAEPVQVAAATPAKAAPAKPAPAPAKPAPTKDRTGIMAAAPVQAAPAAEDAIATLNKEAAETRKDAERPLEDFYKEQQALREKLGLGEDTGAAAYRKQIMEERANAKDEAERQRWMRSAQFFAAWGSTPGPTLAAGLSALQKTMPDFITDQKDLKKANRELDKIMYDIDHATRLEKKGNVDAAITAKEKAAQKAEKLNERLWMYKQGVDVANINKEAHAISAKSAAADRAAARDLQEDRYKHEQYRNALTKQTNVLAEIQRERAGKEYLQLVQDAKIPATAQGVAAQRRDDAKTRLETLETEFANRAKEARGNVEYFGERAGVPKKKETAPAAAPAAPAKVEAPSWMPADIAKKATLAPDGNWYVRDGRTYKKVVQNKE